VSRVRLIERTSGLVDRSEGVREEFRDLESSNGVRSLVMVSVTASVMPVVRTEGFVGASKITGGLRSEGNSDSGVTVCTIFRFNRYSARCVWNSCDFE
jgi:hypothetical protein